MKSLPRALFFAGKLWQSLSPDDLNRVYAWLPARWPTMLATPGGRKMGELRIVPKATLPAHLKFTAFDGDEEFASSGKERWLLDSVVRLDFPCIRAGALHAHPENLRVDGGISMGRGGDDGGDGGDGGGEDGARLSPSEGYASSDSEGEGEDAANDEEEGADLGAGVAAGAGAGAGVQRRRRKLVYLRCNCRRFHTVLYPAAPLVSLCLVRARGEHNHGNFEWERDIERSQYFSTHPEVEALLLAEFDRGTPPLTAVANIEGEVDRYSSLWRADMQRQRDGEAPSGLRLTRTFAKASSAERVVRGRGAQLGERGAAALVHAPSVLRAALEGASAVI